MLPQSQPRAHRTRRPCSLVAPHGHGFLEEITGVETRDAFPRDAWLDPDAARFRLDTGLAVACHPASP